MVEPRFMPEDQGGQQIDHSSSHHEEHTNRQGGRGEL